jgi:lipopolysaccharide export system permease protein
MNEMVARRPALPSIPGRRRLWRYIAGRHLLAMGATLLACAALILMIDLVELLRQSSRAGGVGAARIAWLALLRLPAYLDALIGFAVLIGALGAFLMLARSSELTVMRAAGMSVWQLVAPAVFVAFLIGAVSVAVFNPLASAARAEAERLFAVYFGKESSLLRTGAAGPWLRQEGPEGQSILSAEAAFQQGTRLTGVIAIVFDRQGRFRERVEAAGAQLGDQRWELTDAVVARIGAEPERLPRYLLSTYLTPDRVQDALGSVLSVSIWELPGLIEVAQKAGLPSFRQRVQLEILLSRPFLLVAMVLLAATVSLRSFRFGRVQTKVVAGVVGGVGLFLGSEVSRQMGVAGIAPPRVAVWVPVLATCMIAVTVLLHQEDG